jgi:recombinational DNA repair protein RecR
MFKGVPEAMTILREKGISEEFYYCQQCTHAMRRQACQFCH